MSDDSRRLLNGLKELICKAWKTHAQMVDPDARFRKNDGNAWPLQVVREWQAYNSGPVRYKFIPTAADISHMEVVMEWMAWLRRKEGDQAIRRLAAYARDVPLWQLGQRERCSDRTIRRRIDISIALVLEQFLAEKIELQPINEPERSPSEIRGFVSEPCAPNFDHASSVEPGKVWIDEIGWMFRGKPWTDGSRLAKKYA